MHGTVFSIKRANHDAQKYINQKLRGFPLTAARFDLMFAIHPAFNTLHRVGAYSQKDGVPQRALSYILGVRKQVIHRMLKALLALGFIRREPINKRHWMVRITRLGLRAFRVAARHVWPHIKAAVRRFFQPGNRKPHEWRPRDFYYLTVEEMNGYQWTFGGRTPMSGAPLELYTYGHPDD
jgi:DNA-binding MarR family transcriptional regulator